MSDKLVSGWLSGPLLISLSSVPPGQTGLAARDALQPRHGGLGEPGRVSGANVQAIGAGLLVNKLISNALKQGFPDDRDHEVLMELQAANPTQPSATTRWVCYG